MQNITIGRYAPEEGKITRVHYDGDTEVRRSVDKAYAGWIEGIRDDGSTWILWLDDKGGPVSYWGRREESGAVIGGPIDLAP